MGEQLSIEEVDKHVGAFKYLDEPLAGLALDQLVEL